MRLFSEMLDGAVDVDGVILVVALRACAVLDHHQLLGASLHADAERGLWGFLDLRSARKAGRTEPGSGTGISDPAARSPSFLPCGKSRTCEEEGGSLLFFSQGVF
jgi:hypothetical protein